MAYRAVGAEYSSLGEVQRASQYFTKAFQVRDHASEREKLSIAADYYFSVTGELNKAAQTYQELVESYPRAAGEYGNLGTVYALQGRYEKAAEMASEAVRLAPYQTSNYGNLANYTIALQLFDGARQIIRQAARQKLDDPSYHMTLYALAFLGGDSASMAQQQQWLMSQPEYENFGLALASQTEQYSGHLAKRAGTAEAGRGFRRPNGQPGKRGHMAGDWGTERSGLRRSCESQAVSRRGLEDGSG